jgi:hypothetical protein
LFLLDGNGVLYRLSNAKFDEMLHSPARHRLPRFAGARVRMASVVVGLEDRKPIRIVLTNFAFVPFDKKGGLDVNAYEKPLRARIDLLLGRLRDETEGSKKVIEAANRFVDRRARWEPSHAEVKAIERAALGLVKCERA